HSDKIEKIMDMDTKVLWYPDSKRNTQMDKFRMQVNADYGLNLVNYSDLYQWSVDNYPEFWAQVWCFCGVVSSKTYEEVIDSSKRISDVPEWFKGSRLNYAENLLKHADQDKVAVYAAREGKEEVVKVTFGELRRDVALFAAAMRKMGIRTGDRVVGYLPNGIHALEAMLAAASIGAIWSSTSVDFGVNGVLDRFSQIQPKLIFSVAAVVYNGKVHDHMEKLTNVVKGLPDLNKVVVIPYVRSKQETDLSKIPNSVFIDDFLASGRGEGDQFPQLEFEQLPFNHPLFIMYSSGTTGAPKCMVHSAGGTLIQHLKEHILHGNMATSDVIIYYTTTGWMMWNWLVSSLAVGASVVLYDGSPLMPTPNVLWDLTDQLGITIFGTGAKWLSVLQERNLKPCELWALTRERTQSSQGILQLAEIVRTFSDESFGFSSSDVCPGGTDIVSCFMGQNPTVPVHRGEIQSRNLGMAVEAWSLDERQFSGGCECVCSFAGVWAHGDYCKINPKTGGIVMLGRSDGTLNPNGVRFGSSEIYNIVEAFEDVSDSLCVPQYNADGEERVILFLKMAPGKPFGPELVTKIKGAIRKALSARHVPALLLETKDIPYTISGKKVEVAVKQVIAGREVAQRGAFSNPASLDLYKNIPELQNY
uniref:Acetoacetyl-CoA synthetase n=1 Tax=Nothobranchius furzeri TaxID=105023 RepID=A0A8C6PZX3_NOTFU